MAREGSAKTGSAKPGRAGNEGRDGSAGKPGTGGKGNVSASVIAGSAQPIASHVVLKCVAATVDASGGTTVTAPGAPMTGPGVLSKAATCVNATFTAVAHATNSGARATASGGGTPTPTASAPVACKFPFSVIPLSFTST